MTTVSVYLWKCWIVFNALVCAPVCLHHSVWLCRTADRLLAVNLYPLISGPSRRAEHATGRKHMLANMLTPYLKPSRSKHITIILTTPLLYGPSCKTIRWNGFNVFPSASKTWCMSYQKIWWLAIIPLLAKAASRPASQNQSATTLMK